MKKEREINRQPEVFLLGLFLAELFIWWFNYAHSKSLQHHEYWDGPRGGHISASLVNDIIPFTSTKQPVSIPSLPDSGFAQDGD